jgi:hypothetical protein
MRPVLHEPPRAAKEKAMTVRADAFKTVAKGNGVPIHGDLFKGIYKGAIYRAEFYLDETNGNPVAMLAGDSIVEKNISGEGVLLDKKGMPVSLPVNDSVLEEDIPGEWVAVPVEDMDDDEFNALVNAITPEIAAN